MLKSSRKKAVLLVLQSISLVGRANEDEQQIKEPQIICSMGLKN